MIEIEGIADADKCHFLYPHSWCDDPCDTPPEPLELSDRPEEVAQEEVFREQNVPYTRPDRLGVPYHDRKPDYFFYIDGCGWLSLETKNRNPGSWQGLSEAKRDFTKESPFPTHYWGSFRVTEPAKEHLVRQSSVEITFHKPLGFLYQDNPLGWKEAFAQFIGKLRNLGLKALQEAARNLLKAGKRSWRNHLVSSPVGNPSRQPVSAPSSPNHRVSSSLGEQKGVIGHYGKDKPPIVYGEAMLDSVFPDVRENMLTLLGGPREGIG